MSVSLASLRVLVTSGHSVDDDVVVVDVDIVVVVVVDTGVVVIYTKSLLTSVLCQCPWRVYVYW